MTPANQSPYKVGLRPPLRGGAATTIASPGEGSPMRMTGGFSRASGSPVKRFGSSMKRKIPASRATPSGKKELFHAVGAMTL